MYLGSVGTYLETAGYHKPEHVPDWHGTYYAHGTYLCGWWVLSYAVCTFGGGWYCAGWGTLGSLMCVRFRCCLVLHPGGFTTGLTKRYAVVAGCTGTCQRCNPGSSPGAARRVR